MIEGLIVRVIAHRAIRNVLGVPRMSAIDRIKEKALKARSIAPNAIKALEADLDALMAEEGPLNAARLKAVGAHQEVFQGIRTEIDGVKAAIDILSNGEESDPLPASPPVSPGSPAWLAQNKITPEEHDLAVKAGKIAESQEYYTYIEKLKAEGK